MQNSIFLIILVIGGCRKTTNQTSSSELKGNDISTDTAFIITRDTSENILSQEEFYHIIDYLVYIRDEYDYNRMRLEGDRLIKSLVLKHCSDDRYSLNDLIRIEIGNIFHPMEKYIMTYNPIGENFSVYIYQQTTGNSKIKYQIDSLDNMGFTGDSIVDCNFDGYNDLVLKFYPLAGCCIRNYYRLFIFDPGSGSFNEYKFDETHPWLNMSLDPVAKQVNFVNLEYDYSEGMTYIWQNDSLLLSESCYNQHIFDSKHPTNTNKTVLYYSYPDGIKTLIRTDTSEFIPAKYLEYLTY